MSRYDTDGDGLINLQELTRGLEHDMIKSTPEERRALFNFLDVDRDGNISQEEIYNALIKSGGGKSSGNIETNLQKIKQGASRFKSVEEFVKYLFNKYDADRSGTLSV
jgi:Ca2+-binding EF-hand superfamily protein